MAKNEFRSIKLWSSGLWHRIDDREGYSEMSATNHKASSVITTARASKSLVSVGVNHIKTTSSNEKLLIIQNATESNNPEGHNLNIHGREHLKISQRLWKCYIIQ